jgi:hypothetical protein
MIKLHLGCGMNILDGWINTDSKTSLQGCDYLDVTETFSYDDNRWH